jgi:hypothetical protein
MALQRGREFATIDCELVTIEVPGKTDELILDTATKIGVTPQIETQDAIKLIIKGRLRAQKPQQNVLTGNTIVLTDNVFNPELVMLLQGGELAYDPVTGRVSGYRPPAAGSRDKGEVFKTRAYSAIYNAAGVITGYEKISYPNCQGVPIALSSEDGVFRVSEYTINSAPDTGERPYEIDWITKDMLPKLPDPVIDEPPAITTEDVLPNGIVDESYGVTLEATGREPITWALVNGSLPSGVVLDPVTGTISGTPDTAGSSTFTIRAANGIMPNSDKEFSVLITEE